MEQVLYRFESEQQEISNQLILTYLPADQTGVLKVFGQDKSPDAEEIQPPFDVECWWTGSSVASLSAGEETQVRLYMGVRGSTHKIIFTEMLEVGIEPPLGWKYYPVKGDSKNAIEVKELCLLRQFMQALDNLPMLNKLPVGEVAIDIKELNLQMKFEPLAIPTVLSQIRKLAKVDGLPEAEVKSVAEQINILAYSLYQQSYDAKAALQIVELGQQLEGVSSLPVKILLDETKAKITTLDKKYQTMVQEFGKRQDKVKEKWKKSWSIAIGLFSILLYFLRECVESQ